MKIAGSIITVIGTVISALWGAFIVLDGFIVDRARSEIRPLEVKVDTQYGYIKESLKRIEQKVEGTTKGKVEGK